MYLYMYMYMYVYVHVYVYMYMYMFLCVYIYIYIYVCTYIYMHMHTYKFTDICMYTRLHIIRMCICIYREKYENIHLLIHKYVEFALCNMRDQRSLSPRTENSQSIYIYISTIYMCVCAYIFIYVCFFIHIHMYIYIYLFVCVFIYTHTYLFIYIYIYIYILTCSLVPWEGRENVESCGPAAHSDSAGQESQLSWLSIAVLLQLLAPEQGSGLRA